MSPGAVRRRQPRPEAVLVGPSGAVTARLIVAIRILISGGRHVPFLVGQRMLIGKWLTARVPANERRRGLVGQSRDRCRPWPTAEPALAARWPPRPPKP